MVNRMPDWYLYKALIALLLLSLVALGGCSVAPPKGVDVVKPFELERYLGTWYEIARLDHSFERNLDNVKAQYRLRKDGHVEVINSGYDARTGQRKEAVGVAKFTGAETVGSLKVSFFGPFYGGYHLIGLDPQYRWAMVIGHNRDYLWILARDKRVPAAVREELLQQASGLGIDVSELIWVEQNRDDV